MFISIRRMFKFAWVDFARNWGSNLIAALIMVLIICLISSLFIFQGMTQYLITQIQGRIDISVYFKEEIEEKQVLKVKQELSQFSELKEVKYISKEEALENFQERHKNDPIFIKALEEIGSNPFVASLKIKTKNPQDYEEVSVFLTKGKYSSMIDKVDYYQKKPVIEKISSFTSRVEKVGIAVGGFLALIVFLVIFNAIKLAVYTSEEEISTMKLVGSSNWFVRGPFIIQGALYGLFGCLIALLILFPVTRFFAPKVEGLLLGFNMFDYFVANLWILVAIQVGFGIGLGVISSLIVIRKHLNV